jgi:hypothetical protein
MVTPRATLVTHPLGLFHHLLNQPRKLPLHCGGATETHFECLRYQSQQDQTPRVVVQQAESLQEVRNPDLVNRESIAYRRTHLVTFQPHQ